MTPSEVAIKREVLERYGAPACQCCGFIDTTPTYAFLSLAHLANNGKDHRRALLGSNACGLQFYKRLKATGYPADFSMETQCWNCNRGALANHGVCPHRADGG